MRMVAVEDHFRQALDWARRQGALSWELRARWRKEDSIRHARQGEKIRFARDSLVEGDGFELSVPCRRDRRPRALPAYMSRHAAWSSSNTETAKR
jgi:hypothetical protein